MKNNLLSSKYVSGAIYLIVLSMLLVLVTYRACILSFTHDESLSYEIIKGNEALKNTANYHLLNTILMQMCSKFFGDSEISLRLPNVFSFLIYLLFCYGILKNNRFFISLFVGIPLLMIDPYLLDFFSLARGYGISLAAMMGSIYFLVRENKTENFEKDLIQNFCLSLLLASAGLMANYNLLNFYLSVLGLFIIRYFYYYFIQPNKHLKQLILFISLCLLFCIPIFLSIIRLLFLKENQQLYYGIESFDNTLYSISLCSFDFSAYINGFPEFVVIIAKSIFAAAFLYIIFTKAANKKLAYIFTLITFITIGLFLENKLFEAKFPFNRTALYLIPLFGLLTYYFVLDIWMGINLNGLKIMLGSIYVVFTFLLLFNFCHKLILIQVGEQANDANIRDAIETLMKQEDVKHLKNNKVKFSVNWMFFPSTNYYINTRHYPIEAIKIQSEADYNGDYIFDFYENVKIPNKELIRAFVDTPTGLYKRL